MRIEILKSKIHRVAVVESRLDYIGSITIDEDLMDFEEAKMFKPRIIFSDTTTNKFLKQ